MKRRAERAFILAVCTVVIMLIAGCEEQNLARKSRLLAAENIQLKEQLEQCEKEVEKQNALEEQSKERIAGMMDTISKTIGEKNKKLREENKTLKTQIMQLEARVRQLEKELEELKKQAPLPLPPSPQPLLSTPNAL